jgi:hypothetical protein
MCWKATNAAKQEYYISSGVVDHLAGAAGGWAGSSYASPSVAIPFPRLATVGAVVAASEPNCPSSERIVSHHAQLREGRSNLISGANPTRRAADSIRRTIKFNDERGNEVGVGAASRRIVYQIVPRC